MNPAKGWLIGRFNSGDGACPIAISCTSVGLTKERKVKFTMSLTLWLICLYIITMACSSNTLVIGRPSQQKFDQASCNTGVKTSVGSGGCGSGTSSCGSFFGAHDRKLTPRKFREKVREDMKDYIMLKLGAPVLKLEFDQQHLDMIVDKILMVFEEYAGPEFFDYYTFATIPGKSVYKLPDDVGVVRNVFYKEIANFAFQASDLDGAIPIEYFYPGGSYSSIQGGLIDPNQPIWGRMGEWVLYKNYEQMFSRASSNIGGWEWVSDMGHIKLYPTPCRGQKVIVHYLQKCKDWKQVNQALLEGAEAEAMIVLGNIRGKYTQIPGPGGGVVLDGDFLRTKGWELYEKWKEELLTRFSQWQLPITLD
jgi:hypothetical protein